jgi:hypothetical protein
MSRVSVRALGGATAFAAIVALPLAGAALLANDLAQIPVRFTGHEPWRPLAPIGPLQPERRFRFELPAADADFLGIRLFAATYFTRPRVAFETCSPRRCLTSEWTVRDNTMIDLPLPEGVRGGEVTLTVRALEGGRLAWWGHEGRPYLRPFLRSDRLSALRRARQYYRAFGLDLLWPALLAHALALVAVILVAVRRATTGTT